VRAQLEDSGCLVDYLEVRTTALDVVNHETNGKLVALVAARLGNTRLIDNLEFTLTPQRPPTLEKSTNA